MIGKIVLKTNLFKIFSESVNFEIQDIFLIFGPSKAKFSLNSDFKQLGKNKNNKPFYSLTNPIENIDMMNDIVENSRKEFKQ